MSLFTLRARLNDLLRQPRRGRAWRLLTTFSLVMVVLSLYIAWRDVSKSVVPMSPAPEFLLIAVVLYVATYALHLVGWHMLATCLLGQSTIRYNVEAVASSSLVKYLPTVLWYILNRVDYYVQCHVPRKLVVFASMVELAIMICSGAVFLFCLWLGAKSSNWELIIVLGSTAIAGAVLVSGKMAWKTAVRYGNGNLTFARGGWSRRWIAAVCAYSLTWPLGACLLFVLMRTFVSVDPSRWLDISQIWLTAGFASYIVGVTIGSLGIIRELSLAIMLAQFWPLAPAIITAVLVKTILTAGDILCSFAALLTIRSFRGGIEHVRNDRNTTSGRSG